MPTVTIATKAFVSLADSAAEVLGYEDLPVVVVGHPVTALPREAVHAMAEAALPEVVQGLSQSASATASTAGPRSPEVH
ncbi:MAG: hypothetical protein HY329_14685 [Chloroflexi bacterium]|nr:hypothetical protein [Chloroflexota bacterium]